MTAKVDADAPGPPKLKPAKLKVVAPKAKLPAKPLAKPTAKPTRGPK
jgi:hypothetical protein